MLGTEAENCGPAEPVVIGPVAEYPAGASSAVSRKLSRLTCGCSFSSVMMPPQVSMANGGVVVDGVDVGGKVDVVVGWVREADVAGEFPQPLTPMSAQTARPISVIS